MSSIPRIGTTVHYKSYGSAGGKYEPTCRAAIVTEMSPARQDPEEIGICVLNPTGIFFDRQVRHDEDEQDGGTWHWPCNAGVPSELPVEPAVLGDGINAQEDETS